MAIYNGRYCWDGTRKDNKDPIAWFGGTYNLKIFAWATPSKKIEHLRSHLCVYSGTGEGQSISTNPEKFAKRICADFALEIERVLWVEDHHLGESGYEIVLFTPASRLGKTVFYRVDKRPPRRIELALIGRAINTLPENNAVDPQL